MWKVVGVWIGALLLCLGACGSTERNPKPKASTSSAGEAGNTGDGGAAGAPPSPAEDGGQAGAESPPIGNEAGSSGVEICEPRARRCDGATLYECDASGTQENILLLCNSPYTFCIDALPGGAQCVAADCQPEVPGCVGNVVKVCNEVGQYPVEGNDCGEQTCFDGECLPRICQPLTYYACQDGNIYHCSNEGTASYLEMECPEGFECLALDTWAECMPDPCAPGSTACLGNQVGTCAAGGGSLSSIAEDCAAEGMVCGSDLLCAESVVDTIASEGTPPSFGGGSWILVNAVDVHTDRLLTLLEAHLVFQQASELTWLIYEWEIDHYVLDHLVVMQAAAGDAVYASGPLSYGLKAGRRYLLGLYSTALTSWDQDLTGSDYLLSFGRAWGGYSLSGGLSALNYFVTDDFLPTPYFKPQLTITTTLLPEP